ncbi:ABC transporter family protein (macronuclear) [Tetrahymena thermophila SB210]|uniref:ABC transporter family protein n=1 Tax=Tetrahymena thermophila (strain SB210) TaxID=312017 RepID=Q22NV5_TETTS|nr:ABC transporter family protein [Tetrahymena thermophila SB210]EAR87056.1 ABC transporter family protein [Tetrahymena thermophila SB210]|eukprot:XP_001007301.1 ABC transporter family protein [Tetrahymena thermophila SB210]
MKTENINTANILTGNLASENIFTEIQSQEKNIPVDLTFKNLNYGVDIKGNHRPILKNVSGIFKQGTVTAILGASGGGKTSLLNVLSQKIRPKSGVKVEGDIKANGKTFNNETFNQFSAYVMQNDILLETLTAKECIKFAADFKLEGTEEYKQQKVDQMIKLLKLGKCQNSLIGGQFLKGISGGERKRVNIGCELITEPSVLFLDEPTSGLDSFTAYIVISALRDYAKQYNKTVIMSIHSPSTDIWNLFDNIILLVQGRMIYQGTQTDILPYFKSIGFECPTNMCPGDYLMNYMTWNEENEKIFPHFYEQYDQRIEPRIQQEINSIKETVIPLKDVVTTYWFQIKKIAERTIISTKRNPLLFKSRVYQTIVMSLFIGLVFLNQDQITKNSTNVEIQNRIGVLFLTGMAMFMKSLNGVLLSFPAEREVFLKEENSKYYSTFSYLVGRLTLEYAQITIYPFINAIFVYFMVGLNTTNAGLFFYFVFVNVLLSYVGNALGLICGTVFTNPRTASALQPIFKLPFVLFAGFYKNRSDYATWIGWIQYLSPFTYALEGLVTNELEFTETPYDILSANDFSIGKWNCVYIIMGLFVFYQCLAAFCLYQKRGTLQ